ncbi:hypothetical protein FSW04_08100 [Baekduia soli]|uniref:VOC domain-containing protein n=1 Tax=Baekduia soli TaxID=496014 RepID=A0A5B8U4F3_9ACTN|nr:VOC family protein [Baekduia soli]QEC47542.1 hypothetical protein FSW04_08100 [Baekduia soli]
MSAGAGVQALHHVGISVASIDEAVRFWEGFLGAPPRYRGTLDRPYLAQVTGYPGIVIEAAIFDLPGGGMIELLEYQDGDLQPQSEESSHPGHLHISLRVADGEAAWRRAVELGARPRSPDGPVRSDGGPNAGAISAYLRIHDGVTLELKQPAAPPSP